MFPKYGYVIWSWLTVIVMAAVMYWIATLPNFDVSSDATNEAVKVVFRMLLYSALFILFYRAVIATLRNTVSRLSAWRSKQEAIEDAEFVLIIETFVVIVSILVTTMYAIFEEYAQIYVAGRAAELKDVLVSVMGVLLTAIVVYSIPVVGELEIAIAHKLRSEFKGKGKKKSKE